jgi:Protein of unknown function (DUF2950)
MKSTSLQATLSAFLCVVSSAFGILVSAAVSAAEPASQNAAASVAAPAAQSGGAQTFGSPEQAADALINAAEKFDVPSLLKIVGRDGEDVVLTGEFSQDRERAQAFAAQAHIKKHVSVDTKTSRAFLLVGEQDWPFALPIVKHGNGWSFDAAAGRQEIFDRRIGSNELDAIEICRGFVEAQYDYAFRKRSGYEPAQYAQRVIASPGKQDGLAWQNADGTWGGPVGKNIAQAIGQGYKMPGDPYHGYFFKVLKGQGPNAPLGQMDFVVKGIMIGGFALVAAPAEYGETGIKTFMVSQAGVVYEKDFGADTLEVFQNMELYNPDKSWTAVHE